MEGIRKEVPPIISESICLMSERRIGVFLDRDGTLNEEVNYVRKPADLRLIEGAGKAVRRLNDVGTVACVISNQSGVARGYLTEDDLIPIHQQLADDLAGFGARLDRIYYCPHHPTAGQTPYDVDCECRKPKPGMLYQGIREFGIDPDQIFVVGDSIVDIQAGNAVQATTILVQTGYGNKSLERCTNEDVHPDFVVPTIVQAVDTIVNIVNRKQERDAY
jgi:D-glycero-D-manno-heptose 1,7-bisphosphate phosphatase